MDLEISDKMLRAANKLTKWRGVFAGWQLGTRPKGDPEADAVRDHRETTMLLRAEVSALLRIIIEQGILREEEVAEILAEEYEALDEAYQERFPGFSTTPRGIMIHDPEAAKKTQEGWKP